MEINLTYKSLVILLAAFYCIAGVYHFINPAFYLGLIPDYIPKAIFINYVVGLVELLLGILILLPKYRKTACYGIMVLLILLVPSHVYFIQIGSCDAGGLCVPNWVSWTRLIVIHPLLIYWAYAVSKN
ncbi:hypothetical protein [Maribacter antarcticus]|uniref:hypothetical protein n=1 Tax=Maribacter antarcticus TaxID=505250 RepID=UPI000478A76A|nr:hypothetical protein [Maribacter antarcticus]